MGSRRSQAPSSAKAEACKRAFAMSHDLSRGSATANSWSHELSSRSGLNFQWSMAKQTQIEGESEHCARVNCESRASPLRSFLSPPPTSLSPEGWSYRCIFIFVQTSTTLAILNPTSGGHMSLPSYECPRDFSQRSWFYNHFFPSL